jgi:hypothetical protein
MNCIKKIIIIKKKKKIKVRKRRGYLGRLFVKKERSREDFWGHNKSKPFHILKPLSLTIPLWWDYININKGKGFPSLLFLPSFLYAINGKTLSLFFFTNKKNPLREFFTF